MILLGDNLQRLREFPDNYFSSVVTDPPYGLKFMGKRWDYDVPSVDLWREVLRVLKPGGHILSFGGTRTYHRMVVAIEDAGFEIRDQIMWIYGSGFPKSHNGAYGGTALKPANEPICLARKPLTGTVAKNFETFGVGGLNIDASRIACKSRPARAATAKVNDSAWGTLQGSKAIGETTQGRWPANVLFDEEAAAMLDEQSGTLKSGALKPYNAKFKEGPTSIPICGEKNWTGESNAGGASRFFYVAKASKRERNAGLEGMPLVESGIKNDSGRGFSESDPHKKIMNQNHHPTVKPVKLMEYLCRLITPPAGIILDPFCGSGSTGVAAFRLGFGFVGMEMSAEYAEIARRRLEA